MVYRTLEVAMWKDERVRMLSPHGKLLFIYLITNRHAHVSGIYYLSPQEAADETGLSIARVNTLLDTLCHTKLISLDRANGVVWVRKMLQKQGRGAKNARSAAAQLCTLHKCSLITDFLEFYKDRRIPYAIPYTEANRVCHQDQDQDQDQDLNSVGADLKPKRKCRRPPSTTTWNPDTSWTIDPEDRQRWTKAYPACDLDRQLAAMDVWLRANPAKARKSNWPKFCMNWLGGEQQRGGDIKSTKPNQPDDKALWDEAIKQEIGRERRPTSPTT